MAKSCRVFATKQMAERALEDSENIMSGGMWVNEIDYRDVAD